MADFENPIKQFNLPGHESGLKETEQIAFGYRANVAVASHLGNNAHELFQALKALGPNGITHSHGDALRQLRQKTQIDR